jgi:hypothetical protein
MALALYVIASLFPGARGAEKLIHRSAAKKRI